MRIPLRQAVVFSVVLSSFAVPLFGTTTPPVPFNSEEHRLIVDLGVSDVVIPASVKFPAGIKFESIAASTYVADFSAAKQLAASQDACYVTKETITTQWGSIDIPFHQAAYNKKMYVPPEAQAPASRLTVLAYNATGSFGGFTVGELAALYGDYRRTTWCDGSGRCFLTNADYGPLAFTRGNEPSKCPGTMHPGAYLHRIGSGLVPPAHGLGNTFKNTASEENDYFEAGWWGDEMIRIANVNEWHFSSAAIGHYVGLHRLALMYLDSARTDSTHWARVLHYEANALHSLTDLFAYGHVVTNRDETTFGIMKGMTDNPGYRWLTRVLSMGGSQRNPESGRITATATLPSPIKDLAVSRNDFAASYTGTWLFRANGERSYHDSLNKVGARVKNLNGDEFQIYGDGKLKESLTDGSAAVIRKAVAASMQSLFTAYDSLATSRSTVTALGAAGSWYFGALKYLPVYIVRDGGGFFRGQWARYADAVVGITGASKTLSGFPRCAVPYLSGADSDWPDKRTSDCAPF